MADLDPALLEQAARTIYTHSTWHAPALYDGVWTCSCGDRIDDLMTGINIAARHQQHLARAVLADVSDELTEGIRTAVARIDIHSPHTSLCRLLDDLHTLIGSPTVEEPPC